MTTVPNLHPKITNAPYKIAIIGQSPGKDETSQSKPFVGASGRELDRFLSRFGILRDACFIGNICQEQPPDNKIATFDWDGKEITSGLSRLKSDLEQFRPNICLLLGGEALHAFKSPDQVPRKKKTKDGLNFVLPNSISDWRGSFFQAHALSPLPGVKCIASYHPAYCIRNYEATPLLMFDIQRALAQATFPELKLPIRDLRVELSFERICEQLHFVINNCREVGTDIEGYWNAISCISFAPRPDYSFTVPFTNTDGSSLWPLIQEVELWRLVSIVLASTTIRKIWQNGLYDRFCLQYGYRIIVNGPPADIMLKTWELYCELPKSLAVQASLYTDEPYWKGERTQTEHKQ